MNDQVGTSVSESVSAAYTAFTDLSGIMGAVVGFVANHKRELLESGFSEIAAEQMAVVAHSMALGLLLHRPRAANGG
ncbi:MAG TPA: hypothetical protein VF244_11010 [Acidimicrobiales bacterium]